MSDTIALAMTGASGAAYGLRLLECLLGAGRDVDLMLSDPARMVVKMEMDLALPARPAELRDFLLERYPRATGRLRVFGKQEWTAPVASGSNPPQAMVVCPCTAGTLSSIAYGASDDLIDRAADVAIKEGRKLILVVREMPLSPIHLENMLKLARLGCIMMPANPGFYHQPASVDDLVDFVVARVLDQLGIAHELLTPWGEDA